MGLVTLTLTVMIMMDRFHVYEEKEWDVEMKRVGGPPGLLCSPMIGLLKP
jgi:hypothetical protein